MRTPVLAISAAAAAGAAATVLLSLSVATSTFAAEESTVRPTSYVAAGSVFQEALADGTTVGTLDYCETGPNQPGRC